VAECRHGSGRDFLARLLNVFRYHAGAACEHDRLSRPAHGAQCRGHGENVSAVCQGFIGAGNRREALLLFHESSFQDIAELTQYQGKIDGNAELELLMDMANILIGACLKGLAISSM